MAQSIEVDEITFVAPDGSKATMKLRNDGMVTFGDCGARCMIKGKQSTSTSSTQSTSEETDE